MERARLQDFSNTFLSHSNLHRMLDNVFNDTAPKVQARWSHFTSRRGRKRVEVSTGVRLVQRYQVMARFQHSGECVLPHRRKV